MRKVNKNTRTLTLTWLNLFRNKWLKPYTNKVKISLSGRYSLDEEELDSTSRANSHYISQGSLVKSLSPYKKRINFTPYVNTILHLPYSTLYPHLFSLIFLSAFVVGGLQEATSYGELTLFHFRGLGQLIIQVEKSYSPTGD